MRENGSGGRRERMEGRVVREKKEGIEGRTVVLNVEEIRG